MISSWKLVEFDYTIAIAALVILILGSAVLSLVIRKELAVGIVLIKVSVVVIYFCFYADGGWFYGGDDTAYYRRGL